MAHDIATQGPKKNWLPTQQSTTKVVADVVWNALRRNVDGTHNLVGLVTYSDASTETIDLPVLSAKP